MTPEIPVLPGLTDLSPLGRGGFADVFLARQAHLDRFVAAKVFRVTLIDRDVVQHRHDHDTDRMAQPDTVMSTE